MTNPRTYYVDLDVNEDADLDQLEDALEEAETIAAYLRGVIEQRSSDDDDEPESFPSVQEELS